LLQDPDDLLFAEPALPHLRLLSTESHSNRGHARGQGRPEANIKDNEMFVVCSIAKERVKGCRFTIPS
ncbi:hypothetical protein, partial [Rhodoplanes serenus]|uniref:hypothetical protein n=1 Tax=Rhodoplanes serenus TaxID=200615 RepID=UPI001AED6BA1